MSKRHLSQQQTQRIRQLQEKRITRSRDESSGDDSHLSPPGTGLVIARYGSRIEVEGIEGAHAGEVWRCHIRSNLDALVTGDHVVWQADSTNRVGVVTALLPRRSLLSRPDPYQRIKPVAANVDRILLVIAPLPAPSAWLIDRYIVACENSEIPVLIVLNKSDLMQGVEAVELRDRLAEYATLGYGHIEVCAQGDLSALSPEIRGQTVVLVGQSGVGKSSLVNALLPDAEQRVNIISDNSGLGQHTTTTSRLFHLPGGGKLIDSPGIREFGLWHLDEESIRQGFAEMRPFYGGCRFRNCRHVTEPGCAVRLAAENGLILPRRLESLHRLMVESKSQ
ncbi:MAG: small ribosomal subunit biogenesis GTPase RsgA [Fluviicoccus sp.]|uniref:small ribosomal subunit biogenesis GTPase RsgA n=1 Tax=Fluviicoccus sp. TaxID=2003552 RepID=UPI002726618D|nr:small ribosomal subunit biogenesis GTPase RsgA [Fluviicoccus sp.]MDO8331843.1 small ribosomal subunit biogenesis GTPase RsgA [Fluviicoccus sp.]